MFAFEERIEHWVNRLSFLLRNEVQERFKAAGQDLSAEEWALLMVIWREGALPMGPLAKKTLKDRTTVTRLVDRLVKKGYLARADNPEDRRQVLIAVTPDGEALKAPVLGAVHPLLEKASAGIDAKDLDTALSVLRRMTENLEDGKI